MSVTRPEALLPTAPLPAVFTTLLAITDDPAAHAAIRMTKALARDLGAVPTVLQVVAESAVADSVPVIPGIAEDELLPEYRNGRLAALEAQVHEALGITPWWHYEVATGSAIPSIIDHARRLPAELIVLGLPHHTALHRAVMRDTVEGVIEEISTPVLAVRPTLTDRPSRVMVAVDFSPASLRAARIARQLLAEHGRMELVYVHPEGNTDVPPAEANGFGGTTGPDTALAMLIDELAPTVGVTINPAITHWSGPGGAAEALRWRAEQFHPDLIAVGSRRHTVVDWFFGDSVSTELVGERRWSMLIVPEPKHVPIQASAEPANGEGTASGSA